MDEKKAAIIRDWVEPAHPMVVRFYDDLLAIYRRIRDKFQQRIDETFDATSRTIGFLVTTTLPLTLEIDKKGIDEIYPELGLVERITRLKDLLRTRVRPDVMEPAHFRDIGRRLPSEALAEIDAVLRRFGYK